MNLALTMVLRSASSTDQRALARSAGIQWTQTVQRLMGCVDEFAWSDTADTDWTVER